MDLSIFFLTSGSALAFTGDLDFSYCDLTGVFYFSTGFSGSLVF
jgi:hypothetical protein